MIGDKTILCLDWDERSLRVVDAAFSRSAVRVRQALLVPMAAGVNVRDPQSLGEFIRRSLAEHRVRTRRAVVDVPRQDAVLTRLSLPFGSHDELASMVHLQMGRELPFSKDQAVIDFAVSREENTTTCDVWVAAVRNPIVDFYRDVVAAAGLKLERIGLRPNANLAALTAQGTSAGRTMLVDVGPSMTEIDIIRDGRLVYSRAASVTVRPAGLLEPPRRPPSSASEREAGDATIPLVEPPPEPAAIDALLVEVGRTLEAYRVGDPGAKLDVIILAGTCGIDQRIVEVFKRRFDTAVRLYEAPESLKWRKRSESAVPFCAAFGLALVDVTEELQHFNFLDPKEPEAERRERVKRMPQIAATVALFLVAGGVWAYQPIRTRQKELDEIRSQVAKVNTDKKERDEFMSKLNDVRAWQQQSVVLLDYFKHLAKVFPSNKDAYLTRVEMSEKGELMLDIAAVDQYVGTRLNEELVAMKDPRNDKSALFVDARPGKPENVKNEKYPVKDQLFVQIKALKPPDKKK